VPQNSLWHSRSERALYRWDIVGGDEIGWEMLTQPELTLHSLKIRTEMPVPAETLANRLQRPTTRDARAGIRQYGPVRASASP
jgi:hypothetical protein